MEDDVVSGATDSVEKEFTCLCKAEKKAKSQMKVDSKGGLGEGFEEVLKSCLHALDACLALLLSYLVGKGNMGKPALVVCELDTK